MERFWFGIDTQSGLRDDFPMKNKNAVALGRLGGKMRTAAKLAAARSNLELARKAKSVKKAESGAVLPTSCKAL